MYDKVLAHGNNFLILLIIDITQYFMRYYYALFTVPRHIPDISNMSSFKYD